MLHDRPGRALLLGGSTACSTASLVERGEPCEVVAAYGIDPVLFMLAAAGVRRQESSSTSPAGSWDAGEIDRGRMRGASQSPPMPSW